MNLLVSMRYLVALDEHKHFARAAQACFVTQPALSNAIRALETEFGAPMVKRGRTFVGFTAEGQRMLVSARRMLHEQEVLQQEFSSVGGRPQGSMVLGAVPSAEPIAARFAAMLQARYPGITPMVRSMSSADIETGLENLRLDMGLGFTERVRPGGLALRTLAQYTEHYFLVGKPEAFDSAALKQDAMPAGAGAVSGAVAAASNRKAAVRLDVLAAAAPGLHIGPPITWAQAATLPLCLMAPEMHNRQIVNAAFTQAGAAVRPAMETNSILTLSLSALGGTVCSVMPGALVGAMRAHSNLIARPLNSPTVHTPIGFLLLPSERISRTLEAALTLAQDAAWLRHAAAHSGLLVV